MTKHKEAVIATLPWEFRKIAESLTIAAIRELYEAVETYRKNLTRSVEYSTSRFPRGEGG